MRRLRNILAVTLVALALCADRATAAVPVSRPFISQIPGQVVRQISKRFQHVVPTVKIVQDRQEGITRLASRDVPVVVVPAGLHGSETTPFQFRLPPPTL
jgi:hypothetical protein